MTTTGAGGYLVSDSANVRPRSGCTPIRVKYSRVTLIPSIDSLPSSDTRKLNDQPYPAIDSNDFASRCHSSQSCAGQRRTPVRLSVRTG